MSLPDRVTLDGAHLNVNQPCYHPSKLFVLVHSADRNASKLSECADVFSCGNTHGRVNKLQSERIKPEPSGVF